MQVGSSIGRASISNIEGSRFESEPACHETFQEEQTMIPNVIASFRGKYRFLSNFYPSVVVLDSEMYTTVEHAFQAAKTEDLQDRKRIRNSRKPSDAKELGRNVKLQADWETTKRSIMEDLVRQKFQDEKLRDQLLATGNAVLIEGNDWGDRFWGVDGDGLNHLGIILMKVRQELREGSHDAGRT